MANSKKEAASGAPAIIEPERFRQIVAALDQREKITDDRGKEIEFTGVVKKEFIGACQTAYPVVSKTYEVINDLGRILSEVRAKLKPLGVYHAWLEFINLPRRTAQNYVQVYDRYKEQLPEFAHLGIRKLLIASKLDDCTDYLAKNLPKIEEKTAQDLETEIKSVLNKTKQAKKRGGGRSSKALRIGDCILRASLKGDKITIEGLTKRRQAQLWEAIKELISQHKV